MIQKMQIVKSAEEPLKSSVWLKEDDEGKLHYFIYGRDGWEEVNTEKTFNTEDSEYLKNICDTEQIGFVTIDDSNLDNTSPGVYRCIEHIGSMSVYYYLFVFRNVQYKISESGIHYRERQDNGDWDSFIKLNVVGNIKNLKMENCYNLVDAINAINGRLSLLEDK